MNSLRDMYVGIHFKDEATRDLEQIDRKMDEIKEKFQRMGADANEAGLGFSRMGSSGERAMNEIGDAAEDATEDMAMLGAAGEGALERVEEGADDAADEVEDLKDKVKSATRQIVGMSAAMGLISVGFSGAVAASAPLLAGVGALAASFGAAGIGAAAFGAVAVGSLTNIFEAQEEVAKLQEKIEKADTTKERIKAQKELAALYAEMSQEQRNALKELQSFQSFWGSFVKQFEKPVFQTFANSLKGLRGLLTGLQPTIKNVADVFVELSGEFNQALQGPAMQRFFDWLETNASESLYNFAHIFGNTFMGIMNILQAFSPLGASFEEGLVRMTQRFEEWTAGLSQSKGFQTFMNYAKSNGPLLVDIFNNLSKMVGGLIEALAPLGTSVLQTLNEITKVTATIAPSFSDLGSAFSGIFDGLTSLIQKFGPSIAQGFNMLMNTFKGLQPQFQEFFNNLAVVIQFISPLIKGVFVGIVTAIKGSFNVIFGVVKVFASLIQGDFRNAWEGVKQIFRGAIQLIIGFVTAGFIGRIGGLFKLFGSKIASVFSSLTSKIGSAMSSAKSKVAAFFSPLNNFISKAKAAWDKLVNAFKNFKMPKIGLPKWMGGNGLIQVPGHATGLSKVPYDNYLMRAHKDETILRADQAKALEQAGILDRSGYTPKINPLGTAPTASPKVAGGSVVFSPKVDIHVTAADVKSAGSLEAAVNRKLEEMFQKFLDIYSVEVVR
jgi:hypothetical protein